MQVPGADPMYIAADFDSVIDALEFHAAPDDLSEISRREEEFVEKAGFTSISGCSSSSSHSTLSVDTTDEPQEERKRFQPEEREHISSLKLKEEEGSSRYGGRYGPRNLLKASKRVTGRASRTVYTKPTLASIKPERLPAPSADEVDAFLGELEGQMDKVQHKLFTERYNFDVANERPLPGRFEWVKVQDQGDHAA
ncbi:hypothetical protein SELMODRAFT_451521 [Selaginella moellendorffii]|uniref:Cyclin-dependent kinase inhibitor n=1 Tax=Selaginella moellendorffii TaxID=88036 RepID=D8RN70_SELML|nr:cyclin-dependent kinase inhibitor 3 [Selaginella moellendorffii]EFJ26669.1 hypothetical protein SELMODRAFT_451521 [Selaginella moellendorffii]|eukprot:XP_002972583.1 cyclin-dependent kinase inhibitor 3 [Selaginella moellendorffii]